MKPTNAETKRRGGPGRLLLRWHRRVGLALSAIILFICLSGIALNHSADLKLNQRIIQAPWLYRWYGFEPKSELIAFETPQGTVSQLERSLFLNDKKIGQSDTIIAALAFQELLILAGPEELMLFTPDGMLIERLTGLALPHGRIERIQCTDTEFILETDKGTYASDSNFLEWNQTSWKNNEINPVRTSPAPDLRDALLSQFRGEGISWHRLLLDLHSGRFFGPAGKWITDLTAIALIFLTSSGIIYTMRFLKKTRSP